MLLHLRRRSEIHPWSNWCLLCWRPNSPAAFLDRHLLNPKLTCSHPEQCNNHPISRWLNLLHLAPSPSWASTTPSFCSYIASIPNLEDPDTESFLLDDDVTVTNSNNITQPLKSLPLELISRRFAHCNFRNLLIVSLHQAWNDHIVAPTVDPNNWPFEFLSATNKTETKLQCHKATNLFTAYTSTLWATLSILTSLQIPTSQPINRFMAAGFRWSNFAFEYPDKCVGHSHTRQSCLTLSKRAV